MGVMLASEAVRRRHLAVRRPLICGVMSELTLYSELAERVLLGSSWS